MPITDQLIYNTIKINCVNENGISSSGTGFFFHFCKKSDSSVPAIVTNKHVVEGCKYGEITFHICDKEGKPNINEKVAITDFGNAWIKHPDDAIDLCVMPIANIITALGEQGKVIFSIGFDISLIPSQNELKSLRAVENILMTGYPIGLSDEVNNFPLVRRGITSTHLANDYNGKPEFVIDAACVPGSSGSPIILYDDGPYTDNMGTTIVGRSRLVLLGILYSGPMLTTHGNIIVRDIPTTTSSLVQTNIPINLGFVIKSSQLRIFDTILESRINSNL